ncbi:hypothetical protein GCM10018780_41800 [Streptomyces lanatus]|nr:hypothetical protein GCM10018780_41800 [Streptomyces lanatus]
MVRHGKMRWISLRARTQTNTDIDYVWHPLPNVEDEEFDVHPRELGPFLRGYIEGWIPDASSLSLNDRPVPTKEQALCQVLSIGASLRVAAR